MRHRIAKKKLSRDKDHRKALSRNLAAALIMHGKIETSLSKAKFVQPYVERLITKAKLTNTDKITRFNTIKLLRTRLYSEEAIKKLVNDIAPSFSLRAGGYTRIVKTGNRGGDNTVMARIELVENPRLKEKQ